MQTQSQLARIEESHFAKMLHAYDASLTEGEKLAEYRKEIAETAINNEETILAIYECDPCAISLKIAQMFMGEISALDLKDWMAEQAETLNSVEQAAITKMEQESFYSDGE